MSRDAAPPPLAIPPSPGALASAVAFLRRGVRPDGSQEDGSDWEVASHQWGLFISWAYNRGVALPAVFAPDRPGGREHDLLFDAAGGRWLKFTKPFSAGWTVEWDGTRFVRRPGTPLGYLRRWQLANRLFNGDTRLVGLSCLGRTQRIVVSQPHFPGDPPTWDEIVHALERRHGLCPLPAELAPPDDPERRAYGCGRLAVFDVCPANAVRRPDGSIAFFDVCPVLCGKTDAT